MLFYQNLQKIIFTRNQLFKCDELIVLSGYVGPSPIAQLENLPFSTKVIYGMYGSDGIQSRLHSALVELSQQLTNVEIYYSTTPIHSKCYIWKYKGEVVHALIGSANFSTNGLTTPFKEILAETTVDTFEALNEYIKIVLVKSIPCREAIASKNRSRFDFVGESEEQRVFDKDVCTMILYDPKTKLVPSSSGLNWGQSEIAHVNPNDAYIPIRAEHIKNYPTLFPRKQEFPKETTGLGRSSRNNDAIEILWDDGTTMIGLLEGSVKKNGVFYPKQISSHPNKKDLGTYIRKRIGISEGVKVKIEDLRRYGRDSIDVSLQGEGIYYFNFSSNK